MSLPESLIRIHRSYRRIATFTMPGVGGERGEERGEEQRERWMGGRGIDSIMAEQSTSRCKLLRNLNRSIASARDQIG